jgi:ABC-type transport system involved in multi-copper enzyme maturation permease subunit
MTFLPIVDRELRVAARRKLTFWGRWWTAVLALVATFFFLLAVSFSQGRANLGNQLFVVLTGYAFFLCFFAGIVLTADCLSEEKREGTLGLLFLTDLRGYDVVLGKFFARSLNAFYGLVAILPATGLTLLLGGVTAGEFWRRNLALVNALFFSLAVGICVSAYSRDSRRALTNTLGCLLTLVLGLPALASLGSVVWPSAWLQAASGVSPLTSFRLAADSLYTGGPSGYWIGLLSSHFFGWLLLAVASWALPRRWQDQPPKPKRAAVLQATRWRRPANVAHRTRIRGQLLSLNPVYWLASLEPASDIGLKLIVLAYALFAVGQAMFFPDEIQHFFSFTLAFPFGMLLKVIFAYTVGRFFVEARRSGALEMVLGTPLTSREILRGHAMALRRTFQAPILFFLCLTFLPVVGGHLFHPTSESDFSSALLVPSFQAAYLTLDFFAIYWAGIWLAISIKRPSLAPALTVLFVAVLPTMFCVLGVFVDLVFIAWGASNLGQDLRLLAARRQELTASNTWTHTSPSGVPPIIPR